VDADSTASAAVCGLPLDPPAGMTQPLEAAVVIKGFDEDGAIAYWTAKTPGLTTVEVLGMLTWGADVALRGE